MNKNFAVCYNSSIINSASLMSKLTSILDSYLVNYVVCDIDDLRSGCDLAFVIGGDGTILKAARFYAAYETVIFGINLGHLGFLSQASESDLEIAIAKIVSGDYVVENRMMLESKSYRVLNDFVIRGEDSSRASSFSLYIDEKFVCDYFADGIIISTPTGSTAYGMAAGGPILSPESKSIAIVPICPHTLSARPIVVSSDSVIKILSHPKQKYIVSADGQNIFSFDKEILVKKSNLSVKLAMLGDNDFYSILRNKLHLGINPTKK